VFTEASSARDGVHEVQGEKVLTAEAVVLVASAPAPLAVESRDMLHEVEREPTRCGRGETRAMALVVPGRSAGDTFDELHVVAPPGQEALDLDG
jgi:hypothetical protein